MKERNPIQIIKNKLQRRNAFPDGNSLCYKGEIDGHFQIPVDVYLAKLEEKIERKTE